MAAYRDPKLKIFSCNANPKLAADIAEHVGVALGEGDVSSFSDGETRVETQMRVYGGTMCTSSSLHRNRSTTTSWNSSS